MRLKLFLPFILNMKEKEIEKVVSLIIIRVRYEKPTNFQMTDSSFFCPKQNMKCYFFSNPKLMLIGISFNVNLVTTTVLYLNLLVFV